VDDAASIAAIRLQIQEAETIVFLGFAFHELNLELISISPISPENPIKAPKRVFGTAWGLSDTDTITVQEDVYAKMLKWPRDTTICADFNLTCSINNKITCCGLFDEYWRSLSRTP
jgi:hypothetical protein